MKERPILFSAPMVRAILEDRKTQTRRVVKPQPFIAELSSGDLDGELVKRPHWCIDLEDDRKRSAWPVGEEPYWTHCRYGKTGELLWVREPRWKIPEPSLKQLCDGADTWPKRFAYVADGDDPETVREWGWKWLPPMFMPRSTARILLEITDVRVQRLQEINEEDAKAEGAEFFDGRPVNHHGWRHDPQLGVVWSTAALSFQHLWGSINGPESWNANPWVWAITFKRIDAAERAV